MVMRMFIRSVVLIGFFARLVPAVRQGTLFDGPFFIVDLGLMAGMAWLLIDESRELKKKKS